jgi:hypothetical protein
LGLGPSGVTYLGADVTTLREVTTEVKLFRPDDATKRYFAGGSIPGRMVMVLEMAGDNTLELTLLLEILELVSGTLLSP